MTHPTDIDLDASAMTRREALEKAQGRLTSVVRFCLDLGLEPDAMDKESIREAFRMVNLALRSDATDASVERVRRLSERRTREMTAELPAADREVLQLKGMV